MGSRSRSPARVCRACAETLIESQLSPSECAPTELDSPSEPEAPEPSQPQPEAPEPSQPEVVIQPQPVQASKLSSASCPSLKLSSSLDSPSQPEAPEPSEAPEASEQQLVVVIEVDDDSPPLFIRTVPIPDNCEACVRPFWHFTNFAEHYLACRESYRGRDFCWDLAPPGPPSDVIHEHIRNIIAVTLSYPMFEYCNFKIGLTALPAQRFLRADYRYLMKFVFVYCTENSSHTAKLEKYMISYYKDLKDKRIENVAPGGEGAHCHVSPHYLYVVFGTRAQFHKGKRLNSYNHNR